MLIIRLKDKDGTTREIPLQEIPATFGRLDRSTVKIEDGSVSREHARLFSSGGSLFIADLNSSNGTFVNGTKVSRAEVKPGDAIRIGRIEMTLEGAEEEPAAILEAASPPPEIVFDEPPARPAVSGDVQVKERILQYSRIDAGRKAGLLRGDLTQIHPGTRLLLIIVFLVLAVGIFFLARWLTERSVPAGWEEEGSAIETELDG